MFSDNINVSGNISNRTNRNSIAFITRDILQFTTSLTVQILHRVFQDFHLNARPFARPPACSRTRNKKHNFNYRDKKNYWYIKSEMIFKYETRIVPNGSFKLYWLRYKKKKNTEETTRIIFKRINILYSHEPCEANIK